WGGPAGYGPRWSTAPPTTSIQLNPSTTQRACVGGRLREDRDGGAEDEREALWRYRAPCRPAREPPRRAWPRRDRLHARPLRRPHGLLARCVAGSPPVHPQQAS